MWANHAKFLLALLPFAHMYIHELIYIVTCLKSPYNYIYILYMYIHSYISYQQLQHITIFLNNIYASISDILFAKCWLLQSKINHKYL